MHNLLRSILITSACITFLSGILNASEKNIHYKSLDMVRKNSETIPVLLIPGLYDSAGKMKKIAQTLQNNQFHHVHAMSISPSNASISFAEMAQQVADQIEIMAVKSSTGQVDIVAFSMGTLATRAYLQEFNSKKRVRRFISLSGPHHGTFTAYLQNKTGTRQMRPGSSFLQNLEKNEGQWAGVEVYSFWTAWDLMIVPAKSSILKGAKNSSFNIIAHPFMVSNKKVLQRILQILQA